ncbi:MAG: cytochrome c biogenesis protein, partial [Chthoniobacterales bacterium]
EGFYRAIWVYGAAFVLLVIGHLRGGSRAAAPSGPKGAAGPDLTGRGARWRLAGVLLAVVGLAFHAGGIALRCMIAGRPPVTNMYESIIWVSFAVTFFGMMFFARYRTPVYLLAALPVTLTALLLVFQMPIAMPASIDPLVPVLRDNFWLTIHVLTITLSYAAFALAMGFGHILLFRYARNPRETRSDAPMHFWLYRVLQLGVLLLAAGTILGGVWANYSWGRFWGWDPKETWALIALLCYITTLHGRLAGWWTQFGLVVASVVCFLAVLMAWYGVNFVLGKGLHSYGFGIGGETYVVSLVIADLLFVAFAVWRYRAGKRINVSGAALARENATA